MTVEEKAKELVDKYLKMHYEADGIGITEKQANQCAIIAVDEVLNEIQDLEIVNNDKWEFWLSVKNHIQSL